MFYDNLEIWNQRFYCVGANLNQRFYCFMKILNLEAALVLRSWGKFKPSLLLGTHRYYCREAEKSNHRSYSARFSIAFIWHSGVAREVCQEHPLTR